MSFFVRPGELGASDRMSEINAKKCMGTEGFVLFCFVFFYGSTLFYS